MKKSIYLTAILLLLTHLAGCARIGAQPNQYQANDQVVVLAHGLGRSDWAMRQFANRLENASYRVCLLDYSTIGKSVEAVLTETDNQINNCTTHAPKIHFVGHSLGGLVIRAYLQNNIQKFKKDEMGQVVLIGTPNKGSELADHLSGSWLMNIGGGISQALMTGRNSLGNHIQELDINIGVIAGTKPSTLTSEFFKGANDGLVTVESTKLKNMGDFITMQVGHTEMRNSQGVAEQTMYFLRHGKFQHDL